MVRIVMALSGIIPRNGSESGFDDNLMENRIAKTATKKVLSQINESTRGDEWICKPKSLFFGS